MDAEQQEGRLDRAFLILSGLAGALAVALGAFAAHGLRGRLAPEALTTWETGVRYLMYHVLALVGVWATAVAWDEATGHRRLADDRRDGALLGVV
jgi:uncharacterized membrane protein YgdD (TMEM256/DUF423 family)